MAKLSKLKRLEKAKVKLKAKKLPKGQNVTDTSFKTKKILIPGQLRGPEEGDIYTRKKLNVTELLTHLQHHNMSMRREGILGLNELVNLYEDGIIKLHLPKVLDAVCGLVLDVERDIRKSALSLIETIFAKVSYQQIVPHFNILRTYMSCAMTHINRGIREDSLLLLDNLLDVCPLLMAIKADEILPIFLNMISTVKNESERSRTLSVDLESRLTGVQWRMKVFARMTKYFAAIVATKKRGKPSGLKGKQKEVTTESTSKIVKWKENSTLYAAEFMPFTSEICHLNALCHAPVVNEAVNPHPFTMNQDNSLKEHIKCLMPVLFEAWLETAPEEVNVITQESAVMLQYIVETLQHVWDCLENWEEDANAKIMTPWFTTEYGADILKAFLPGFPYSLQENVFKHKGAQSKPALLHYEQSLKENLRSLDSKLTQQNLSLSYLFACIDDGKSKNLVKPLVKFVRSCVMDFDSMELLPVLEKVLRTVVEKPWPKADILQAVTKKIEDQSVDKDLCQVLFLFMCDVVVIPENHSNLRAEKCERWLSELSCYALQSDVSLNVVKALQSLACHNHKKFVDPLKRRAKNIIRSLFEMHITGSSTQIEGQKAVLDMLFPVADQEIFNYLLKVVGNSEDQKHEELLAYANNLKDLSEYLSL